MRRGVAKVDWFGSPCRIVTTHRVQRGPVAQGLEQSAHNRSVGGSIPSGPTKFHFVFWLEEVLV